MLVAGIASFAATRLDRHTAKPVTARDAIAIAREFVATAVVRKQLERAWELAGPELENGQSKAEWLTGTIAVTPYRGDISRASYKLESASGDAALVGVTFGSGGRFALTLHRHGGRWLVAGWSPRGVIHPGG